MLPHSLRRSARAFLAATIVAITAGTAAFASTQCLGTTRSGERCKNKVASGSYCYLHTPTAVKCSATTKAGTKCANNAKAGSTYCHVHGK